MTLSKSKKYMLIYVVFLVFMILMMIPMGITNTGSSSYRYSPTNNMIWDSAIIIIPMLLSPILGYLLAYLLAPVLLKLHRLVFKSKNTYGIEELTQPKELKFRFSRLFFPALMTINFSMILSTNLFMKQIILADISDQSLSLIFMMAPSMAITSFLCVGIFAAVYFLMDSSIVYTRKEPSNSITTEVRSVGSWFLYLLKGYAGISVIFNFYEFISETIVIFGSSSEISSLFGVVIWPFMPFFATILFAPLSILLFDFFEHRKQFMLKKARKMGITINFEVIVNES